MSKAQVHLLRQILGAAGGKRPPLTKLRLNFDRLLSRFGGPEAATRPARLPGLHEEATAEWIDARPDSDARAQRTILYLHGGGFALGSIDSHRGVVARLSQEADAPVLSLGYRLAPEWPFPAAVDDACTALTALLDAADGPRLDPSRLIVAGDSAGGGLAVMAVARRRDQGASLPAALYLLSPWTDYAGTGDTLFAHADLDPLVQKDGLDDLARLYLGDVDPWDPKVCPLTADLTGLPPFLIQAGGDETLLDDARRLHTCALDAGVDSRLDIWPHMIHVWPLFASRLDEGQEALEAVGRWIRERVVDRDG